MKIAQLIFSLDYGGAEKFCINLSNELSKKNDVTILSLKDHSSEMLSLESVGERVKFRSLGLKRRFHPANWARTYKALKQINPDIIHTHLSTIVYVIPYALMHRKKVVHTVHSLAQNDANRYTRKLLRVIFRIKRFCPVSISEQVHESVQHTYTPHHTPLIINGIPPAKTTPSLKAVQEEINGYRLNRQTKIILNVASVKSIKNQEFLVREIKKLSDEGANIVFLNVGAVPPSSQPYFHSFSEHLGPCIRFLGVKDNVGDYLQCADVFTLASEYEGMPLTLLEAFSMGIIPLCTNVGGMTGMLKPVNEREYLFPLNDGAIFREKLLNILGKDEASRKAQQAQLKTLFGHLYTISICAEKYQSLYNKLIHD